MVRLQKFLADAGVASRRASEQLILEGRVKVDGQIVRRLGTTIDAAAEVAVDGRTVKPKRKLYVALNKPRGYICSRRDPQARRTIGDLLPKEWSELYPVGRLDYDSEGLIFLTNDGQFCLRLTHPRYEIIKKYFALVKGQVTAQLLRPLTKGVYDHGELLKARRVRLVKSAAQSSLVELDLAEGKNREVRRLFESQGVTVLRLQRVQIGPVRLGELPTGKWRTLTETEIKSLLPSV
jgi:23S rRNA pseudouridine2605 synthase